MSINKTDVEYFVTEYISIEGEKFQITKSDWKERKESKALISHIRYIEQKYDLMISNYYDFEKELLEQSLDSSLRNVDRDWIDFKYLELTRKIINLVTSIALYINHLETRHLVKLRFSDTKKKEFLSELKLLKKDNLDIRFIINLRNYIIHRDLPLDTYSMGGSWEKIGKDEIEKLGHVIIPFVEKENLFKDSKFSSTVAKNYPDNKGKIDLRLPIRKSIKVLSDLNKSFRDLISTDYEYAKDNVLKAIEEFNSLSGKKSNYCDIIEVIDYQINDRIHLAKRHINQIELFYKRNRAQGILERRYVHNRI